MEIKDKKRLMKLMSFLTMSDGSVYRGRGAGNCLFSLSATEDHKDFIDYCAGVVGNITSSKVMLVEREPPRRNLLKLYTPVHPYFNKLRDRIYVGNYKSLDSHALKMLDFEALAILYMADGCLGKWERAPDKCSYTTTINMCRLSYGDQWLLKKAIKDKTGIEFNVVKTGGKYFTLRLRRPYLQQFMDGIRPFILGSFNYKLISEQVAPQPVGGEIV